MLVEGPVLGRECDVEKFSANGGLYRLRDLKALTIAVSQYLAELSCYIQEDLVPEDTDIELVEPRANHGICLCWNALLFVDNVFANVEVRDPLYKKPKTITYEIVKTSGDGGGNSS